MTEPGFVIVGGGLAAAKAAEQLRERDYDGPVTIVSAESYVPYERPPLSKGYLKGKEPLDKVFPQPRSWYADNDVRLLLSTSATAVDTGAHLVQLDDGSAVAYSRLLLATGSRPRTLTIPGANASNVQTLRTIDDSNRLREAIASSGHIVVIGAGWIGLEAASAMRDAGVGVTIVESASLPLQRVLGDEMAAVFADLHRSHGVDLRLGASLEQIAVTDGRATAVRLGDGTEIAADTILVGVGIEPRTELAEAAGLDVDNGILVDASMRTSDPDVFACGDVANAFHPVLKRRIRVEHWANALNQPAVAAASMLGDDASYDRLPYFFSDQYDLGMEYLGYAGPDDYDDVVVRGSVETREFLAFWTSSGRVVAAMNVNIWDVTDDFRALILSGAVIDRAKLADPAVPLAELVP